MAKLQEEIAEALLDKLKKSPNVTPAMVEGLRTLFLAKKKLKPDDLVEVFSPPVGGEVK